MIKIGAEARQFEGEDYFSKNEISPSSTASARWR